MLLELLLIASVKSAIALLVVITAAAYTVWLERKLVGRMQTRIGPNRVGPFGLLQPLADAIKLFFKETFIPREADKALFLIAPGISLVAALLTIAVLPFGETVTVLGREIMLSITDLNIGVLYILAVSSLGVYGIVLAGWSSNNKYSLLGGLRSSAQMISYELALGLSLVGVLMLAGSASLREIASAQQAVPFVVLQPLAFVIYLIAAFAETNRAPFDLPEAETELVAGYHTEYSGMRFATFFLAEYANLITVAILASVLFLGGWHLPVVGVVGSGWLAVVLGVLWLLLKVLVLLFCFIWVRATLPRIRYDRLMQLGWKGLLPLGLLNIFATGLGVELLARGWPAPLLVAANVALTLAALELLFRLARPLAAPAAAGARAAAGAAARGGE
ncbi:MAG: NADH-quinone oxidoreductase subunit NuoH [Chloroflexi bacterium]|nr:NADH-quinone oxidoreductase subunit NuoH [Chloroflexota bacterium]